LSKRQQQIPCGDDNKKGDGKDKGNRRSLRDDNKRTDNGKGKSEIQGFFAALRMTRGRVWSGTNKRKTRANADPWAGASLEEGGRASLDNLPFR
jgi:hypothetical protein